MSKKRWEVVDVLYGYLLPEILCGLLVSQGIPAITCREGYARAKGIYYGPVGETEILVPSDYLNQALEILDLYYDDAFMTVSEAKDL